MLDTTPRTISLSCRLPPCSLTSDRAPLLFNAITTSETNCSLSLRCQDWSQITRSLIGSHCSGVFTGS